MKRLIYLEPLEEGHSEFWAKFILESAITGPDYDEVILVSGPRLSRVFSELAEREPSFHIATLSEEQMLELKNGNLLKKGLAEWRFAHRLMQEYDESCCFLPFFDHALIGAVLDRRHAGRGVLGGIVFRPPNTYGRKETFKTKLNDFRRWIMYRMASRLPQVRLFTLDPTVANAAARPAGKKIFTYLPDPAPHLDGLGAFTARPRSDGRQVHLLFGSIAQRKGVLTLLEAVQYIPRERQKEIVIRIVGRLVPSEANRIRERLDAARINNPDIAIEVEDRFVSDSELAQEIADAAVVLAPYQNHRGSSGVVYWAAAAGKPLLSQNTGLMGLQVDENKLGTTIVSTDPIALAKGISNGVSDVCEESTAAFLEEHSGENFARIILEEMRSQ